MAKRPDGEPNSKKTVGGIRDVLAFARMDGRFEPLVKYATALAKFCGADLTVLAMPSNGSRYDSLRGARSSIIENIRSEDRQAAQAFRRRVGDLAAVEGVPCGVRIVDPNDIEPTDGIRLFARHFDVTVIAMPGGEIAGGQNSLLETVAEHSGRAVLAAPRDFAGRARFSKIMLVWDGSRAAARAFAEALPLLARADRVNIALISESNAADAGFGSVEIKRHLLRHGVSGERIELIPGSGVANALLEQAVSMDADLIVMGAYGYSRSRECIDPEGARFMLRQSSTPILLAH